MVIGLLVAAACQPAAMAVVLHTDVPMTPAQHPPDQVIGRWRYNASCVVVGPSLILTTTHQLGPVGSTVTIDGVDYEATWPGSYYGGPSGDDDIRLANLWRNGEPADLGYWVDLAPFGTDVTDQAVVIGGYGMGRGPTLTTAGGVPYGYQWDMQPNTTLRWGRNLVDEQILGYMIAKFDGIGSGRAIPFEAAVGEYDSGGGWFRWTDGRWRVVGLTTGAEHATMDQTWFANSVTGAEQPDRIDAIRIERYESWLNDQMALAMPAPGDADRDGDVDYDDLVMLAAGYGMMANAGWSAGNFDGDGDVDLVDLGIMAEHYGDGAPTGRSFFEDLKSIDFIPEPACLLLMLPGVLVLRRRRSRTA